MTVGRDNNGEVGQVGRKWRVEREVKGRDEKGRVGAVMFILVSL